MAETARILVIDDEEAHASSTAESLERKGYACTVASSGAEGLKCIEQGDFDVVITDLVMQDVDGMEILAAAKKRIPDVEVIVMTAHGSVESAVAAMQQGATTYLEKPLHVAELRTVVKKALENQRLARNNVQLRQQLDERFGFEGIIGNHPRMKKIFDQLRQVAPTSATVLIYGESGTGKELIAKAIHNNSPRRNAPFAPLNCAALAENLLESELFGHEKGAFTGAVSRRIGRFEYADGGTLFLDEVGSMPMPLQAKLLRALEGGEITRLGNNEPIRVNVRLLAATNQDLAAMVEEGTFRKDLYFRLKVVAINLPPLRERKDDIPLLVDAFIRELSEKHGKKIEGIDPKALDALMRYDWPGNVRELRNWLESMIVVARGNILTIEDFPDTFSLQDEEPPSAAGAPSLAGMSLAEAERELIANTLKAVNGNREEAARILGIGERTLYRKLNRYGLK